MLHCLDCKAGYHAPESFSNVSGVGDPIVCGKRLELLRSRGPKGPSDVLPKYTLSLDIPFTLRDDGKGFLLPTFYSCFICRVYNLRLTVSVATSNVKIGLGVPLSDQRPGSV